MTGRLRPASRAALATLVAVSVVSGCGAEPAGPPQEEARSPLGRTAAESLTVRVELATRDPAIAEVRRETVLLGSDVEVVAAPGPPGRMHVRGFETTSTPLEPGVLRFRADTAGALVVEDEETGLALLLIEVVPPVDG
ncbi:hypothetical protein Psed_4358 [Pseudonocardia dioxanivorans CB1190]|uniref:Lipoprotein n=1 Tax=Pseudonocardia dioxanivorans (strain ATCC 55486 / DSM 44775 / JCM 13855 / CB1190) TaxID=675635 RepID=F4CXE2_PSEUX|nr:hypothetical protein [Pseudonocardia dioxanivorans]AEA26516.1 hypothetical protein Psed_4358 [Pseudonocardia dioxanivorans CB1190]